MGENSYLMGSIPISSLIRGVLKGAGVTSYISYVSATVSEWTGIKTTFHHNWHLPCRQLKERPFTATLAKLTGTEKVKFTLPQLYQGYESHAQGRKTLRETRSTLVRLLASCKTQQGNWLQLAWVGSVELNQRTHHHPQQRGHGLSVSFQLKPEVGMFTRHNKRWREAKPFPLAIHQWQHQGCPPYALPWTPVKGQLSLAFILVESHVLNKHAC